MIADYINPHGKPTNQYNSIEFLLAQVIKGTYEYGEDKILQTTLPKAMIDHAFKLYEEEIQKAYDDGYRKGNTKKIQIDSKWKLLSLQSK